MGHDGKGCWSPGVSLSLFEMADILHSGEPKWISGATRELRMSELWAFRALFNGVILSCGRPIEWLFLKRASKEDDVLDMKWPFWLFGSSGSNLGHTCILMIDNPMEAADSTQWWMAFKILWMRRGYTWLYLQEFGGRSCSKEAF